MLALKVDFDVGRHVLHGVTCLLGFFELHSLLHELVGRRLLDIGHLCRLVRRRSVV